MNLKQRLLCSVVTLSLTAPLLLLWLGMGPILPLITKNSTTVYTSSLVSTIQTQTPYPAKFQRNDCFNHNGIREVWEPSPDGIVAMVGQASYLLIYRTEAEQRVGVGGTKVALPVSIQMFDESHYLTPCPETWKNHTHEERRKDGVKTH